LGLRSGNAFTEAETGEPLISRQNALKFAPNRILNFKIFPGVIPPDPYPLGALPPDPRERREGKEGWRRGINFGPPTFQIKVTPLQLWYSAWTIVS